MKRRRDHLDTQQPHHAPFDIHLIAFLVIHHIYLNPSLQSVRTNSPVHVIQPYCEQMKIIHFRIDTPPLEVVSPLVLAFHIYPLLHRTFISLNQVSDSKRIPILFYYTGLANLLVSRRIF